jgi:membrane fusion protein, adhesin transport system
VQKIYVTGAGSQYVTAGANLVDIVPTDGVTVVEANFEPRQMKDVRPGLQASVRITAYKYSEPLLGTVTAISPTAFDNQRGSYFKVSITTQPNADIALSPGLQAEVSVNVGQRTILAALLDPVFKTASKALREP